MTKNPTHKKPHQGKKPNHARQQDGKPRGRKQRSIQKPDTSSNAVLFGLHAVREAWLNPDRDIKNLYITDNALDGFKDILAQAEAKNIKRPGPEIYEKSAIDKITGGGVHQGIAINAEHLPEISVQELVSRTHTKQSATIIVLDQVTDPHNVGAIIRSASAFGIDGLIMQKKHSPALDGVLAKTACGGLDHLKIATATNLSRAIEELQAGGFLVVGLDERAEHTIDQLQEVADAVNRSPNSSAQSSNNKLAVAGTPRMKSPEKVVLVLGSEGSGLRHNIREKCDSLIKLPTQGAIKSLNVSNAAAIAFYVVTQAENTQK